MTRDGKAWGCPGYSAERRTTHHGNFGPWYCNVLAPDGSVCARSQAKSAEEAEGMAGMIAHALDAYGGQRGVERKLAARVAELEAALAHGKGG